MQYVKHIPYLTNNKIYLELTYKDFGLPIDTDKSEDNDTDDQQSNIVWCGSIHFDKNKMIKIKKEKVVIELDEDSDKAYESEYKYFSIDETPIFFLIPVYDTTEWKSIHRRIDTVNYLMTDNDLVKHAFFLHALEWVNKYQEDSPFLTYLSIILNEIYTLTGEIVENIEAEIELDDDEYLIEAVVDALKLSFFEFYYDQALDSVIEHDLPSILQDLFPDEYEDYENMDIWELYDTNEDFRKAVDESAQDTLNYWWDEAERRSDFKEKVAKAIKRTITSAWQGKAYSRERMTAVMFHKKLLSLIHVDGYLNKSIVIKIRIEKINNNENKSWAKVITLRYLNLIMSNPKHVINCSFGSFNMVNRLMVLSAVSDEPKFTDYNDLYYKSVHNVLSIEAEYDNYGVEIKELAFDFLEPNEDFSSFKTEQEIDVTLDPNKMQILFKNYNQLFSMLMRASLFGLKMYNRVFRSDFDINKTLIMAYGVLLPPTQS